ncbi:unnamed protein product [Mytilus coruscus]|uniref:Mab-21-like HhH/H2TH-like domain-containing protein n=1 Tax=Mytilus coruscus TaxID=42192 RepID=A0A6J8AE32_MYTCO|nr:unnamed protein product [Mytilus coruscus]
MEKMSKWRSESLKFYKYLCQEIGSEKVVRTRRLAFTIRDMGHGQKMITSGSIGEGLELTGSDLDFMFIDPNFKVYQSETEVQSQCSKNSLIMDNKESHPCFTQLRSLDPNTMTIPFNIFQMNNRGNDVFSSELYKLWWKNKAVTHIPELCFGKIHGPCISDKDDTVDIAWCLKCDKWIYQAKPWISRPRATWPPPEIISKIVSRINYFASSESLHDNQSRSYEITQSLISKNQRFLESVSTFSSIRFYGRVDRFSKLLYNFLHHSRTNLSKGLFALQLSAAFMLVPEETRYPNCAGNKHHYFRYKHDLSHLVIGLHSDAVSGLLKLASFFYFHKNYVASLTVITYTLTKCTDEKIYQTYSDKNITLNHIQQYAVKFMKIENLNTIIKSLTIHPFRFEKDSSITPQELQLDVTRNLNSFHPLKFAHFLSFLCYYHLHDMTSCGQSLLRLKQAQWTLSNVFNTIVHHPQSLNTVIFCGIGHQLIGETDIARLAFQVAAKFDMDNETSAASRLSSLI